MKGACWRQWAIFHQLELEGVTILSWQRTFSKIALDASVAVQGWTGTRNKAITSYLLGTNRRCRGGVVTDGWPSGRRRAPGKCVYVKSVSWVRIPPHPPVSKRSALSARWISPLNGRIPGVVLSRTYAALIAHLGCLAFESQGAFASQR